MDLQNLPQGSIVLLFVCAVAGVATWYLSNFSNMNGLAKLSALIGISSMLTLVAWVVFG